MRLHRRLWNEQRELVALALVMSAALLLYSVFILRTGFTVGGQTYYTLVDDAMISMRYAKHLAEGHGMVWNLGEPPIEGFTNLAWMLLMSVYHLLPVPPSKISLLVMLTSTILLLLNMLIVYHICRAVYPRWPLASIAAAFLVAFLYSLVFWSLRGMEVGAITTLINLAALLAIRTARRLELRWCFLLCAIVVLSLSVRIDAAAQIAVIVCFLFFSIRFKESPGLVVFPTLALIAGLAALLLFQYLYFGDPLPNTYYLKVTGVSLIERLMRGTWALVLNASGEFLLPLLLAVGGMLLYRRMRTKESFLLLGMFLVQCIYSVWVGGDYMENQVPMANRFIIQGMPSLIILASVAAYRMVSDLTSAKQAQRTRTSHLSPFAIAMVSIAICLVIGGRLWSAWAVGNAYELAFDISKAKLGLHIKENTSEHARVAAFACGQVPYYSERYTIDLLGKSDPVIAHGTPVGPFIPGHSKWNYDHSILELKPDLVTTDWFEIGSYLNQQPQWLRLDNGIYVRTDSALVSVQGLAQSYTP